MNLDLTWWHAVLVLVLWGGLCVSAGMRSGRRRPSRAALDAAYGPALDKAYDDGWDASALAHAQLVPSAGRGAADDGPAPLPVSPMMCPGGARCVRGPEPHQWCLPVSPMMCPGGARCVRGPEPHQWSADCEEDEGWAELPGPDTGSVATGETLRAYAPGNLVQVRAGGHYEDWLDTMHRELAPESERPASATDQFHAVFSTTDGLERECLLVWDYARRYERDRPAYLREMGVSDERIRELLGSE